jgi:hypothetical protein
MVIAMVIAFRTAPARQIHRLMRKISMAYYRLIIPSVIKCSNH